MICHPQILFPAGERVVSVMLREGHFGLMILPKQRGSWHPIPPPFIQSVGHRYQKNDGEDKGTSCRSPSGPAAERGRPEDTAFCVWCKIEVHGRVRPRRPGLHTPCALSFLFVCGTSDAVDISGEGRFRVGALRRALEGDQPEPTSYDRRATSESRRTESGKAHFAADAVGHDNTVGERTREMCIVEFG